MKYTGEMKVWLYGEVGEKPPKEEESRVLAVEAAKSKLLQQMCTQVAPLGFEVRGARAARAEAPQHAQALSSWRSQHATTMDMSCVAGTKRRGAGLQRLASAHCGRQPARR